jgi:hypothetical protein
VSRPGLDQHQVRTWRSWHRYTPLVLVAYAFLAVLAAAQPRPAPSMLPAADELPPLSVAEIRRLLIHVFTTPHVTIEQALPWLAWRLTHQARARHYHHKRRTLLYISQ